jgi:hypothetical protein
MSLPLGRFVRQGGRLIRYKGRTGESDNFASIESFACGWWKPFLISDFIPLGFRHDGRGQEIAKVGSMSVRERYANGELRLS